MYSENYNYVIFGFPSEFEALRKDRMQTEHLPDKDGCDQFRLNKFRLDLVLQRMYTAGMFFLNDGLARKC